MEHIVNFRAGHDCIKFECKYDSERCFPGKGGSHGVHGLEIIFIVKGEKGAVQFLLFTGWLPQKTQTDTYAIRDWGNRMMPADLGYHAREPQYEGHRQATSSCEYCGGEPCYYDGSGLHASDALYALVNQGEEGLWKFLEAYYLAIFEGADYPALVEYPKSLREAVE